MRVVVLAKKGSWSVIGLFLRQRLVGRTIAVKFRTGRGSSVFRQGCLSSNEVRTIIRKDSRCEFVLRRCSATDKRHDGQQQAQYQEQSSQCILPMLAPMLAGWPASTLVPALKRGIVRSRRGDEAICLLRETVQDLHAGQPQIKYHGSLHVS
jgi:hypothetical protein